MVAILNNIRSAYNVGSMFRTADGAGFRKLYLCGVTPTPLDVLGHPRKDIAKVALGAEKTVEWEKVARTADCIKRLRDERYVVYALELAPGAIPYHTPALFKNKKKIALLVGNEVRGISKVLRERCDATIMIPMHGKKESLNVAVAFGIAAFEIAKYTVK